jgi:Fic family protein
MEDYFHFYDVHRDTASLHTILLAAEMHERLVTIHPFVDGNGRTARLVMNLILLQHGYPIAILKGDTESRLAYYHALERCNLEHDKQEFYQLIATTVIEALEKRLRSVEEPGDDEPNQ